MRESTPAKPSSSRNNVGPSMLSKCLVESDPAVRAAGRRTRVASVGASLLIQAALLTLLIIVPLFAAGKLPAMRFDAPTPIFRRGDPGPPPETGATPQPGASKGTGKRPPVGPIHRPTHIPPTVTMFDETYSGPPEMDSRERGVPGGDNKIGVPLVGGDSNQSPPPPPTPATASKPIVMSKGVMEARLIHRVIPCYPPLAKQIRLSGTVQLRAIIATDGTVQSLEVLSGHPILIQCAVDAVKQWRYKPTLLNDQPVEVETFITVNFVLGR